jgi:hypothetical protein
MRSGRGALVAVFAAFIAPFHRFPVRPVGNATLGLWNGKGPPSGYLIPKEEKNKSRIASAI